MEAEAEVPMTRGRMAWEFARHIVGLIGLVAIIYYMGHVYWALLTGHTYCVG